MRHPSIIKASLACICFVVLLLLGACKKESVTSPKQTGGTTPVTAASVDSTYYMKGTFGGQPLKIEGNNLSYFGIDTTITTTYPWGTCNGGQGNNGQWGPNQNISQNQSLPVYVSGTKWVNINTNEIQSTSASVEMRSLDVRVYVSPIANANMQTQFYHLLAPNTPYTFASVAVPQQGIYITILDKSGVTWTSLGDQTGSTFQLSTVGGNVTGVPYTAISGVFSINVYDGNGNVKTLNNVTFSADAGI